MRQVKHRTIPFRPSVRKGLVVFMWLLCFFGVLLPSWAEGATWYVKEGGAGANNGSDWDNAYADLQDALGAAGDGDEIWVAAGSYKPAAADRGISFELKTGVALYGGFPNTGDPTMDDRDPAAHVTILTGDLSGNDDFDVTNGGYQGGTGSDNSWHVVTADGVDETAVLDGFTITGGNTPDSQFGGGMYNINSASPTVRNCTFTKNAGSFGGGGMANSNASPTVTDCIFSQNFTKNSSESLGGGGMYNFDSSPTLRNCTFSDNTANNNNGGGMYNKSNSDPVIHDCTFSNNTANKNGGGIYNDSSSPEMTNCTFSGNSATGQGGGIYNDSSSPAITNCTFSENTADDSGGGIYNHTSTPTVTNCIFWGDDPGTTAGQIAGGGTFTYSVTDQAGTGNTTEDPKLGALADNGGPTQTCMLGAGSSALDAGNNAAAPATDQRGVNRPQPTGGTVDMGSVEVQQRGTLTVTLTPAGAVTAGAKWSIDGGTTWRDSGTSPNLLVGTYTITYKEVDDYTKPADEGATVTAGNETTKTGAYTTLTPTPGPSTAPTVAPTSVPPGPDPEPTTAPTVAPTAIPTVAPTPEPTPVPVQPVDPPVIPTDTPLPEDAEPEIAVPLTVTVPPEATPEEKKDALREALQEALVPGERIESIVELLDIDNTGQVYITPDGMDQLRNLLEDLEIPEGAENGPLAVFKASLGGDFYGMRLAGNDKTAVLFFLLPEGFIGKTADRVHVVKMLSSDEAVPFTQVFAMEDLKDTCSAVVEMEHLAGGDVLKRLLASKDLVTTDCRVALAIMDGGSFDLDGMVNNSVTDPAFVIEAEEKENPAPEPSQGPSGGGGGGCRVGVVPLATLLLALPLVLLKR